MIRVADLDVVFISYDEPEAEAHFQHLSEIVPRAIRVHGVKGFDAAHRSAGETSKTTRVVTVDGDNWIVDPDFFDSTLDLAPAQGNAVLSFRARNPMNGLEYGNGGVKVWPRSTLKTLRTHENTRIEASAVDFCWTLPYFQCDRVVSEVRTNATSYHAFRAGFREGVKLTMNAGQTAFAAFPDRTPLDALHVHVGERNLERLRLWCSVGTDRENGEWGILGARLGCHMAADGFEVGHIADFDWIAEFWRTKVHPVAADPRHRSEWMRQLGADLRSRIGLLIADLDSDASRFVRSIYSPKRMYGPMPVR